MDRILLTELVEMLGVKKVESVRQWCKGRGIKIFGRHGHRWVPALDVDIELDREFISYLIDRYGQENWFSVYSLYNNGDIEGLVEVKFSSAIKKRQPRSIGYTPQSEASAKFLNEFK